jgi:hypothetical protein
LRKIWNWVKHRIQHKAHHLKLSNLVDTLKEHGLALVVIIVVWEIIEDVLFPVLFFFLGNYVHPVFYAGAPAAWLLCLHWLAVPILWSAWVKISKKKLTNNKKKDIFNIR